MDMLKIHADARSEVRDIFHEFLLRYKNEMNIVYGFVEGKEDPSFYRTKIELLLPDNWEVDLRKVGNKDKVIQLYKIFSWSRFSKKRIVFFIDRDLSKILGEILPIEENIYITDKYSIENEVISRSTCNTMLTDICNIDMLRDEEEKVILDLFEEQLKIFREKMVPIMSWIIIWRRKGYNPLLNNIHMKDLFKISYGKLQLIPKPKKLANYEEYIHKQCKIEMSPTTDITSVTKEFLEANGFQMFIRGKYELWFLVSFVLSVYEKITKFTNKVTSCPKMHVRISPQNALVFLAPRLRIPNSLKTFLNNTCIKYAKENNGREQVMT